MKRLIPIVFILTVLVTSSVYSQATPSVQQRAKWLKRFPAADIDKDGTLSVEEANAFRKKLESDRNKNPGSKGVKRDFKVDPGWDKWKDQLGHLGPGFDRLEGYVFYATLYRKSPELIERKIEFADKGDFPGPELDAVFRKIAWQAVINHPLSGVTDKNGDGIGD